MDKLPISVIIITYNEEKNIADCLKSVCGWVDEVFVVDSGSTDRTLGIAAGCGAKIHHHPFENFAQQRNWSQDNLPLKNEWVLHLDADERIDKRLFEELNKEFSMPKLPDGFMASRRTIFRGKWIRHGGHYPVYHLRIFKKEKGRSEERFYDQNYIVNGGVKKIPGDIINIIDSDIETWKQKHLRWARLEAREVLGNPGRILNLDPLGNEIEKRNWARYRIYYRVPLFARALIYFFYRYVLRLGFLDGRQGAVFHYLHGLWYRMKVDLEISKLIISKNVHTRS